MSEMVPKALYDELLEKLTKREQKIGSLQEQLAQKEKELKEFFPVLSIQKCIESYECLVAPELRDPQSVFNHPALARLRNMNQLFDYHEGKWLLIMSKTTDTRVIQLKALLTAEGIPEDQFCRSMAGFFIYSSAAIHVPSIKQYSEKVMKRALIDTFGVNDDVTIRSVTKVLMKVS